MENQAKEITMTEISNIEYIPELTIELWEKIFLILSKDSSFTLLPRCCKKFYRVFKQPDLQVIKYITQYGEYLVFFQLYKRHRTSLTFELTESLLRRGVPLPKYLIEMAYGTKLSVQLPPGTIERFLAYGYKTYGDKLCIGGVATTDIINSSVAFNNDANVYITAMEDPSENLEKLKDIVYKHYYSPSFNPLQSEAEWERVYNGIAKIVLLDPVFGYHLTKTCGQPIEKANEHVVTHLILNPETKSENVQLARQAGFSFTSSIAVSFMCNMDPLDSTFPDDALLRAIFTQEELVDFAIQSLNIIQRENTSVAFRICDNLISKFNLSEEAVLKALTPDEADILAMDTERGYHLPVTTTFGVFNGGMSDAFWPLLSTKFGVGHAFMEMCLIDLLVGGTVSHRMTPKKEVPQSRVSSLLDYFGKSIPPLDSETEAATRQSLAAMVEIGVKLGPQSFQTITKMIYDTRKVPSRFVDYMRHLEKSILKAPVSGRTEWIELFETQVLKNREWISLQSQEQDESPIKQDTQTPRRPSFVSILQSVTDSVRSIDPREGRYREIRKFYSRLQMLTTLLLAEQDSSVDAITETVASPTKNVVENEPKDSSIPPNINIKETNNGIKINTNGKLQKLLPFEDWLTDIDYISEYPDLTPAVPAPDTKQSSWGGWF